MDMSDNGVYKIRPAGRHLLTIGRDLIQDNYAAVVELVKNAYDADSPDVEISFTAEDNPKGYTITIKDHGHGMSQDTVINKWMVPSTKDKLERKISPSGRTMQGRKGIGRYAASVLGTDLLLETVDNFGEKTTVFVEWDTFEHSEYLDDVEILVETQPSAECSGTILTIKGNQSNYEEWNKKQFDKLRFELKKLISPTPTESILNEEYKKFEIRLAISGFSDISDVNELIEPYPIFELFDYKITGKITSDGQGKLMYSLQKARNTIKEEIIIDLEQETGCGDLTFDIRVYDRESESIDALIQKGLKDEFGNYVSKLQARQLLNDSNGIGVYRNGFRIRPLGDPAFDWLRLNEQRVQNPSQRIGSNQVIGYVLIQSEEQSGLIEKSARDGLRENQAYEHLKEITKKVIGKLEERRFSYRRRAGLSKPALKVERELEKLFSMDSLKKEIRKKLINQGMKDQAADEVIALISREEKSKEKTVAEIRQAVATYQGQATLGKIITVVMHEGRRPLNYFRNEVPRISRFQKKLLETGDKKNIDEIVAIAKGVESNAATFSDLFKRLDPLASGRRASPNELRIKQEIQRCFEVFRQDTEDSLIQVEIRGDDDLTFLTWQQDIQAIFTNLIDNSVFWLKEKSSMNPRKITVDIESENNKLIYIDFRDTGPGIEPALLEDGVIFEPQFSTKPAGTGIGLAIAGEAAERNGLKLTALQSDTGAYFRLQIKDINNE
ncbi:sensor histidine kinase [Rodentibacter heidelbergensis]|uniref:histidine kinase n=1 Tax=Rodentibacter heidelbergensis TaxID=1908258 RepID=A0A1V3I917_9PAST|nr:sensor histidine kinase [Rodentibacter heidelbergensis]OOF36453.1 ATP-binding protein [Rodentibacter heidelbergensis]